MPENPNIISGKIVAQDLTRSFSRATAYILLEDVSRMDAQAQPVMKQVIHGVSGTRGGDLVVQFGLGGELPDSRASYSLRVHVDLDGDGMVTPGDFISTESYPLDFLEDPTRLVVRVTEV